jgi:hypothetical protein
MAAVVKVGNGRLHDMVTTWSLEVWLTSMRAFRPFSMHRSYSALNSAAVKAGGGLGQAGSSTLAHAPPLTMLAHVEEMREVGGGVRRGIRHLIPSRPGWSAFNPIGGGGRVAGGVG